MPHPTRARLKAWALKAALAVSSLAVSAFLAEFALLVIGSPAGVPIQITHPPNDTITRESFEFSYEFKTNSQGLRSKEIPLEKPPGAKRVLVLGDSFTEGWGVEADKVFCSRLEDSFATAGRQVAFLNGGMSGRGPLEYGRLFFNIGVKYSPDAVLICLFANDVTDTPADAKPENLHMSHLKPAERYKTADKFLKRASSTLFPRLFYRMHQAKENIRNRNKPSQEGMVREGKPRKYDVIGRIMREARENDIPEATIQRWRESLDPKWVELANSGMVNWYLLIFGLYNPHYFSDMVDIDRPEAEEKYAAMMRLVEETVRGARERGMDAGIVLIPTHYMYDPSTHEPDSQYPQKRCGVIARREWLSGQTEIQRRLASWTAERGFPYLDLTPAFREARASGPPLNYAFDGHWNPEGHRLAAATIGKWLRESKPFKKLDL